MRAACCQPRQRFQSFLTFLRFYFRWLLSKALGLLLTNNLCQCVKLQVLSVEDFSLKAYIFLDINWLDCASQGSMFIWIFSLCFSSVDSCIVNWIKLSHGHLKSLKKHKNLITEYAVDITWLLWPWSFYKAGLRYGIVCRSCFLFLQEEERW